MTQVSTSVWLVSGYATLLILVAHACDRTARRVAQRTQSWRTGSFTYHADHDAWVCPRDQWLWPVSFDPHLRTTKYRASAVVCNSCPVKQTCTTSNGGREIVREVDPWPHSEAGRFHRGIACSVALLALLLPMATLATSRQPLDAIVLLVVVVLVIVTGLPLLAHLRTTPSGFPAHLPQDSTQAIRQDGVIPVQDRFSTRWNRFEPKDRMMP